MIYYTHNGTTPVPGNGTTFKYSGSVTVPAGDDWFLKAMATKSGMINSDVTTSGEYNNTNPITAPAGAPPPGGNAAATAAFTAPAPRTVSYAFTAADPLNRDSVTENGVLTNYTANKMNQYSNVRGQALGYDNNFNLSDDNTHSYSFNAQNELVGVDGVTVQLVYDGLGRVLKRTINGSATIFVYDGWKVIEELDGSGNRVAWNIYGAGADEILYRNQRGTALLYHTDKEGNVMFLLDGAGNGIERYSYDAFGAANVMDWAGNLRSVSAYGNRYLFNGKDYVAEMGVYDYRHRWYQPQLGRFLQVDPLGLQNEGVKFSAEQTALYPKGEAPEKFASTELNLYRYCADDPVNKTDPMGLIWDVPAPLKEDFNAARAYLSKDPALKAIFDSIDKSSVKVSIVPTNSNTRNEHAYSSKADGSIAFQWNPRAGIKTLKDGKISPALVLGHEAAHAERYTREPARMAADNRLGSDRKFGTTEERRVFQIENHAARLLGEGVRTTGAGEFFPTGSVTSGGSPY